MSDAEPMDRDLPDEEVERVAESMADPVDGPTAPEGDRTFPRERAQPDDAVEP